ncbi:MAG: AI-2E family transporter [Candidatus Korobacteraceae bacterium]|jgi:predicted PurR-regulated permease PerM
MPDQLLDNPKPAHKDADPDVEANAAGGPAVVPQVSINRSTVAELERRRILHVQSTALVILASAAVLTLIYVGKLLLVVILVSILLSFVLAPIVDVLVRLGVPRAMSALLAVGLLVSALGLASYGSYSRALEFMHEVPKYKARIQAMGAQLREQAEQIEKTTETVLPENEAEQHAVTVKQSSSWTDLVSRNANSVSEFLLALTFIPFLVFFMLSWQDHVRSSTVMLFNMENRNSAYVMLGLIARMIRSFIVGNFIIGVFLSACSIALFGAIGLPYFYFLGAISGFLSLIPYLGVLLAILPPLIADLGRLTAGVALLIIGSVLGLHLIGMNVLYPKILGKRLQLNPLAVTLALLFWGWLWGAMGLILAVPITGALKIICDHIDRLRPYGTWLGE